VVDHSIEDERRADTLRSKQIRLHLCRRSKDRHSRTEANSGILSEARKHLNPAENMEIGVERFLLRGTFVMGAKWEDCV
jgi:hypothetical protein